MIIAIFGDIHGCLRQMYELCQSWQKENCPIDLVLQCGDMGPSKNVDPSDRSPSASDDYLSGKKTAPIETWFVHGNHDDFELCAEKENQPLDAAGRIIYLGPASTRRFEKDGESITVAGLGGMEYRFGKYELPSKQRIQKYLYPPALEELKREKPDVDILVMHDAPLNKGLADKFPTGSKRITELIENLQPKFLFYGHYDNPPEPFEIARTFCAGMNFKKAKKVPGADGAMAILNTEKMEFSFVK